MAYVFGKFKILVSFGQGYAVFFHFIIYFAVADRLDNKPYKASIGKLFFAELLSFAPCAHAGNGKIQKLTKKKVPKFFAYPILFVYFYHTFYT
ncbi:hypothetical protein D918_04396 [Trichuris suis]|nr:hypothetical protein D918_04396 [Trichuris suis]